MTRVPGLGAKKVRRLYDELGVTDLDSLRAAAEQEQIREMKGFGAKVEERVLAELENLPAEGDESERRILSKVLPVAYELKEAIEAHPASGKVAVTGSARRWGETCKDIDLIATSDDPRGLGKALAEHELVAQASSAGDKGTSVLTHTGVKVDLRITPKETFGNLLQHFTGSMEHNVQLRERALKRGLSVSEHGVTETEPKKGKKPKVHRYEDEAGVYELLGLDYIEPELRQGRGEIEAAEAGELPELVTVKDIKGDLHSHTTLSDGRNSVDEMAQAARKRGYGYLAITDHSASHGFGDHVDPKALAKRIEEVAKWNEKAPKGFRLLAGSEVNIGTDGGLDYSDELLAELDWVVASVHTSFGISEKDMTERVVEAIEPPARRLHRAPDRPPAAAARALRDRRREGRRGRGRQRHDDRDQRQPEPPRPERGPRPPRRGGRGDDLLQHRRPRRRHPREHGLLGRHRAARLADQGAGGEHAAVAKLRAAAQAPQGLEEVASCVRERGGSGWCPPGGLPRPQARAS